MLRKLIQRLAPSRDSAFIAADRLIAEGRKAEERGDLREACGRYREAVALAPGHPATHLNLGAGLEVAGDADGALKSYETLLTLDPGDAYANYNLGRLYFMRLAYARAEPYLRTALERKPAFPEALVVLANLLDARDDTAAAADLLAQATRLRPRDFISWLRYGQVLLKLKRSQDAEPALKQALALQPDDVDAHGLLSELHRSRNDFASAARHLEAVLRQRPDWSDALFSYAYLLTHLHRFDDADAVLSRIVALEPNREAAHQARMDVLARGGRLREMLDLCRARQRLAPDRYEYECIEIFSLNFLDTLSAEELFERHKAFGRKLENAVPLRYGTYASDRDPERPLRIGYVSGDFTYHPVGRFLIPLLDRHDRSRFEAHCYSVGVFEDGFTPRIRAAAHVWHEAGTLSESVLADAVHGDRIDVLIDLSGHSGMARLETFACRPAPVQASWLGYLNTTGLTRIQYRISDPTCDPPGISEHLHTERLVRLPSIQWCYRPFVATDPAPAAPCEARNFITFGSFTQIPKLTATVLALWARILREVPDSRLAIGGVPQGGIRDELLHALEQHGIQPHRVTLVPFVQGEGYFRAFDGVDVALDTSPYSGGTTTCDALWMGVPVLTMPGTRSTSRSAASVIRAVGLTDWIATSAEDYVRRAVGFAAQRDLIARLRRTLRDRMQASPLMDEFRFARDIEGLYRTMWRAWCLGERAGKMT